MDFAEVKFTHIIVGAGSAGCLLANRLSAKVSNRVLLLEAGDWDAVGEAAALLTDNSIASSADTDEINQFADGVSTDGSSAAGSKNTAKVADELEELIEAGIVLKGSEIKSVRDGKVNIADSYAVEKNGEIILINSHISPYKQASYSNHNPTDERKLLLNKREISKLIGKMQRDGFTIVPTKMYFKKGKAKIELAVAKGKKQYDKRATKKSRDWNREKARYIRKSS